MLAFCERERSGRRVGEQLAFVGLDSARQPADGMFFAIFPDEVAAVNISRLIESQRRVCGLKGRPILMERLHASLHHIGCYVGVPCGITTAAFEAAAAVVMSPFDVAFDRVVSFSGRSGNQPFVLRGGDGVVGLMVLHERLGAAMQRVGLGRWVKSQHEPHVTLLYDDRCVAEQAIDAVSWTVREFVVAHACAVRDSTPVSADSRCVADFAGRSQTTPSRLPGGLRLIPTLSTASDRRYD
jgi:2'-5' RNA ligase